MFVICLTIKTTALLTLFKLNVLHVTWQELLFLFHLLNVFELIHSDVRGIASVISHARYIILSPS